MCSVSSELESLPLSSPEQMTVAVWEYVFFGGDLPTTDIPPESLRFEIQIYAELFDTFGSKQG